MSRRCQASDLRLDEFLRILDYVLLAADTVSASSALLFCLSPSLVPLVYVIPCARVASDHCWLRLKAHQYTSRLAVGLKHSLINLMAKLRGSAGLWPDNNDGAR